MSASLGRLAARRQSPRALYAGAWAAASSVDCAWITSRSNVLGFMNCFLPARFSALARWAARCCGESLG